MGDNVRVRIHAKQRVEYSQIIEVTPEQWREMKATHEQDMLDNGGPLGGWIDLRDVCDAGPFEDVEIVAVGDDDRPLKPADEWGNDLQD